MIVARIYSKTAEERRNGLANKRKKDKKRVLKRGGEKKEKKKKRKKEGREGKAGQVKGGVIRYRHRR